MQHEFAAAGEHVREAYDEARESASRGYEQARGVVRHHPMSSVLVSFGVGFGVGVLLTALLHEEKENWYNRYMPNRLRGVPDSLRHFGDSLRHIPEHLGHLPESVAKYMPSR